MKAYRYRGWKIIPLTDSSGVFDRKKRRERRCDCVDETGQVCDLRDNRGRTRTRGSLIRVESNFRVEISPRPNICRVGESQNVEFAGAALPELRFGRGEVFRELNFPARALVSSYVTRTFVYHYCVHIYNNALYIYI